MFIRTMGGEPDRLRPTSPASMQSHTDTEGMIWHVLAP